MITTDERTPGWLACVAAARREQSLAEAERITREYRERSATAAMAALLDERAPAGPPPRTPADVRRGRRGRKLAALIEAHPEVIEAAWPQIEERVGHLIGRALAAVLTPPPPADRPPLAPAAAPDPGDGDPAQDLPGWAQPAREYETGDAWEPPVEVRS